jgi:hypothetical protein
MYISRIVIRHFRNFKHFDVPIQSGVTCIVGEKEKKRWAEEKVSGTVSKEEKVSGTVSMLAFLFSSAALRSQRASHTPEL